MLNEMSRSMGQPDFYPFVLPAEAVGKLHFIHLLVSSGNWLQPVENAPQAPSQIQAQTQDGTEGNAGTQQDAGTVVSS
jgi:hypothetical protein